MFQVTLVNKKTNETKKVDINTTSLYSAMRASKRYVPDPKNWHVLHIKNLEELEKSPKKG